MDNIDQESLKWLGEQYQPLSSAIAKNAGAAVTHPDAAPNQKERVDQWVEGLRAVEKLLAPVALSKPEEVPIIAPLLVSKALSAFMQQSLVYMDGLEVVFKTYVTQLGGDDERIDELTAALQEAASGMIGVSMNSLRHAMSTRPDRRMSPGQDGSTNALEYWRSRHEEFKELWAGALEESDTIDQAALLYQQRLMQFVEEENPEAFAKYKKNDMSMEDIAAFAERSGIPEEKLMEAFAAQQSELGEGVARGNND